MSPVQKLSIISYLIPVGQTGGNIWSSDYSEYEEYDLENESLNPQSTSGSDEKEVGRTARGKTNMP